MRLPRRKRETSAPTCAHCLALEYKIAKLEPKAGDVFVLRVPEQHSDFDLQALVAQVQVLTPEVTWVIVRGDIDLTRARGFDPASIARL